MAKDANTGSAVAASEAPGGDTAPAQPKKSGRSKRYTFYEDGKDWVLLTIQRDPQSGAQVENGALIAIPGAPRFETSTEAVKWLKTPGETQATLTGFSVLVVKMGHKFSVTVEAQPAITIQEDQRFERTPASADAK